MCDWGNSEGGTEEKGGVSIGAGGTEAPQGGSKQKQCRDRQAVHRTDFALTPAGDGW